MMGRIDVLRGIKEAESSATASLEDAKSKAVQTLTNARKKAAVIIKDANEKSQIETQASLSGARDSASVEADKVSTEGESALEAIHSSGVDRRQDAIKLVLSGFDE
jgi:ATP synthase H subunit